MSFAWRPTQIPGLFVTTRPRFGDARGSFTKVLGEGDAGAGKPFVAQEMFWSSSVRGTFRGLHLQVPPHQTRKLVFVTHGVVRDFVVDVRKGSPTEGEVWRMELTADGGAVVIPEGCAHGFEVLSADASMVYAQEAFYSADQDTGVLFSSVGIELDAQSPTISDRDLALPPLRDFDSPFVFA